MNEINSALVTPAGPSPGLAYSAVLACPVQPARVFLVCSERSLEQGVKALQQTGRMMVCRTLRFADPRNGTDEVVDLVRLAEADLAQDRPYVLYANLSGGTMLMHLAVFQIARRAERLGIPVHRFGITDLRSREEQLANPYVGIAPDWID